MTKEELLKKYRKLIYKVIKDKHCIIVTEDDFQTFYDAGIIGLIEAINSFDKNKEETTTYFYNCISNGINREIKSQNTHKRKINFIEKDSLDQELPNGNMYYELFADDNINIELEVIQKEKYETLYKAINMLKKDYKDIICKCYGINQNKMTLEKIAKNYNVTRQAINFKKNNALKDLKKYLIKLGVDRVE